MSKVLSSGGQEEEDTEAEETASAAVTDEDEEEKDSSCPVSEDRREQERRSTVCRELQRRSSGRLCSVTFTQPETHTRVRTGGCASGAALAPLS